MNDNISIRKLSEIESKEFEDKQFLRIDYLFLDIEKRPVSEWKCVIQKTEEDIKNEF